jgi:hypothetical protein
MHAALHPAPPSPQYWLDRQWIHDHYADLVRDHANQSVAVHSGRILAAATDLAAVQRAAQAACSTPDIVFQFIDDGSLIF